MFEYWCHEQSYAPASFHLMMRSRMERMRDHRWKRVRDLLEHDPVYVTTVLDEVRSRGPIPARRLSDPGEKTGPWWGYGKGKVALAWLFATGQVAVSRRVNFERWYDRPERVLPSEILAEPDPSPEEAHRLRVREAAGALGIATVADLADYFRMKITPTARAVRRLVATGELREVTVAGWERPAYVSPSAVLPRTRRGTALLCPFDPLVWDRDRTERMFGFRYPHRDLHASSKAGIRLLRASFPDGRSPGGSGRCESRPAGGRAPDPRRARRAGHRSGCGRQSAGR